MEEAYLGKFEGQWTLVATVPIEPDDVTRT